MLYAYEYSLSCRALYQVSEHVALTSSWVVRGTDGDAGVERTDEQP